MKVVDRATFLNLPPGTVYAKFSDPDKPNTVDMGELCIKTDYRGKPPLDWYAVGLAAWPAYHNTNGLLDIFDRLKAGDDLPPDFETGTDDGMFDRGQLFAVFTDADVAALIARLERARAQAHIG
jgi:hypothetical protein